jgi:hypothetical protein
VNVIEARTALRWALGNPDTAAEAGTKLWGQVSEAIPRVLTTAGAFMLAEWAAKKFGLPAPVKPSFQMQPLDLPDFSPSIVEKISYVDQSYVDQSRLMSNSTNMQFIARRAAASSKKIMTESAEKVQKAAAADGSDPVENLRERDTRSILRARLEYEKARKAT